MSRCKELRRVNTFAGILFTTLLLGSPSTSLCQDVSELKNLSLEELLSLEVTSATKTKGFSINRAPSVIRVFTRSDFEKYGFETLRDVLTSVPGIQVQEYRAAHQLTWFRGVKSRYNNKVLWLVDGVPLRDSYYGHNSIDEMLPLDVVERVEIINGPGSVLYGANAFSGVVSIVTRTPQNIPTGDRAAQLSYGSNDTAQAALELTKGPVYAYGNYLTTSGFSPQLNSDGKTWSHPQDANRTFALVKIGNDALRGAFGLSDYTYAEKYRESARDRFLTRTPVYGSLQYRKELGSQAYLKVLGYVEPYRLTKEETRFTEPGVVKSRTEEDLDTMLYGADLDFTYTAGKHTFVAGSSVQTDQNSNTRIATLFPEASVEPGLAVPDVRRHNVGVFVQDIWSFTDHLDLTGGVRYDYLSDFDDEVSYRIGLTGERGDLYGKLLFGTAFRVPAYREYLDVVSYNFSLQPEHLRTLEVQVGSRIPRGDFNLTFYRNRYNDLIKELFVDVIQGVEGDRVVDDEYSINADTSTITGIELKTTLFATERLNFLVGAATILSAKETIGALDSSIVTSTPTVTTERDSFFLSDFTANALVSYRFARGNHRIGCEATYYSDRKVPDGYQSRVPVENRDPSNANGFLKLDAFTTINLVKKLALQLHVKNALDRRIYSPPIDDAAKFDIEWPGRTFRANIVFRY